ncbi:MAG: DUF393 domain-containing protein [Bdellovibrionales bacterium]|nr:DUF393 domain-containing protein [Bdellovibrionales bacterium]
MQEKLKVYYDGACHLCSREIDHYRKQKHSDRLHLIDISLSDFDAKAEGLDPKEVQKYFHIKTTNGEVVTGVAAFSQIWQTLEIFKPLEVLYRLPVSHQLMNLGYIVFAKVRPLLPKRNCENGHCQIN